MASTTPADEPPRPNGDDAKVVEALVPLLYEELRGAARRQLRTRSAGRSSTLSTTALVNEAYLKLATSHGSLTWRDRGHFLSIAGTAMRQIVVDHARRRIAAKRGGDADVVTLDTDVPIIDRQAELVIDIDDALRELATLNPRMAEVVELRFFGGLSEEDTAEALGVNVRTVQRDWLKARAVLGAALGA